MVEKAQTADVSSIKTELDQALSTLDLALLEAGRSVATVRGHMAQVIELAERSREMEAAMSRAREQLTVSFENGDAAPKLLALPSLEQIDEIEAPAMEPDPQLDQYADNVNAVLDKQLQREETAPVMEPDPQLDQYADKVNAVLDKQLEREETASIPAPTPSAETSRCLRLAVRSKSGNLDLKEVDSSVNENPSVIDVALLDYDGRQATLKLWINEAADPDGVRDALLSSLRNHLGKKDTELNIELEDDSSA